MEALETKICSKCGEEKLITEFTFNKTYGKYCNPCKACKKAYLKRYNEENNERLRANKKVYGSLHKEHLAAVKKKRYEENAEEIRAKAVSYYHANRERILEYKQWYYKSNKEDMLAWHRSHYKENITKILVNKHKYYLQNKERVLVYAKAYRKINKGVMRVWRNNRRARLARLEGYHTKADLEEMYLEQLGRCVYCGCRLEDNFHVDHIVPVSRSGSSGYAYNLQLLCPSCNCSKSNKTHEEYIEYLSVIKQAA